MTVTLCPKCNGTGNIEAPEGHFMRGIVYQCDCGVLRKNTVRWKLAQEADAIRRVIEAVEKEG